MEGLSPVPAFTTCSTASWSCTARMTTIQGQGAGADPLLFRHKPPDLPHPTSWILGRKLPSRPSYTCGHLRPRFGGGYCGAGSSGAWLRKSPMARGVVGLRPSKLPASVSSSLNKKFRHSTNWVSDFCGPGCALGRRKVIVAKTMKLREGGDWSTPGSDQAHTREPRDRSQPCLLATFLLPLMSRRPAL